MQTLGASYGSGLLENLGFFYQALPAAEGGLVAPTIVQREGEAELVLGSPGGLRGIDAVVQVLGRVIDLEQPLKSAVQAPRLVVSRSEARLFLEGVAWEDSTSLRAVAEPTWGASVGAHARARGFANGEQPSGPWPAGLDPWFGGVNAVARRGGTWIAVGDDRRGGFGGVLTDGAPALEPAHRPARELAAAPGG
jgi:gamma-glutamyltranspeptidase